MKRSCEELVSYLKSHYSLAPATTLLTGTPIVPPRDFTLQEGDVVDIEIEKIGVLSNTVRVV